MAADVDREPRRLERLRQELEDEVALELPIQALEELAYARYMKPHEGLRPAYGAITPTSGSRQVRGAGIPLPSTAGYVGSPSNLEVVRLFADGRTSFVLRDGKRSPRLGVDRAWRGTEASLSRYASDHSVVVVQRLASGRIRIFNDGKIYSEDSGVWLVRSSASKYQEDLLRYLSAEQVGVALEVLNLCVHWLSPAGHGATLVWFPNDQLKGLVNDPVGNLPYADTAGALAVPGLSAADNAHAPAIAHALGQLDRAVVIGPDGSLRAMNVTLLRAESASELTFSGGTRHNSAGGYSASEPRAIVFVVSADGPVTIFRNGERIASIDR